MITVREVPFADATARVLWDAQQAELLARYGEEDVDAVLEDDGIIASLVGESDGEVIATGLLRWSPYSTAPGTAEAKRLYLVPEHRGHGHSRVMMGAVESAARKAGAIRIVVETGLKQPEAIGLYESIGYSRIANYGTYGDLPDSVCLGKELPTRVLVLNGTMGAGKTAIAGACFGLLEREGAHVAQIDADYLAQAHPSAPGDRFNEALMFRNLTAIAPNYRAYGIGLVIIARPIEDSEGPQRFAIAFASSAAGAAEVTVVRLDASEGTRQERLREREPADFYEGFAKERTVELQAGIVAAGVDDGVVENDGRDANDVAREVLALLS